MIHNFSFYFPTRIAFGEGSVSQLSGMLQSLDAKKVIVVTDKGIRSTGIYDSICQLIGAAGVEMVTCDEVRPNPRDQDADRAGKFARSENVDAVIGLGGGSSMDMAKAVAAMLTNEGGIEAVMKPNKLKNKAAPCICIPTTAGTGSEVTSFAVLTVEKEKRKSSIFDDKVRPVAAINDPGLLKEIPPRIAASTGLDALTHAIEAYTCRLATPVTDGLALHSIKYIAKSLEKMVKNRDSDSCYDMMLGSLLAGIAFGFSDIAGVHCMAEALGGLYDTPHGVANSIFLPIVFEYNIEADIKKHMEVGVAMGIDSSGKTDLEVAKEAVERIKALSRAVEVPLLSQLGYVKGEDFGFLSSLCIKNVSLSSNARELSKEDFQKLFEKAYME